MGQRLFLGLMLGVFLVFSGSHAIGADNVDIKQRLDEGQQAYDATNYLEAMAKWQQGLELAKKSGDQKAIGDFSSSLGLVYAELGQDDQALKYQQQALAIKRRIKDRQGEGNALRNLGKVYYKLRQYDPALEYYQQALAIARDLKDRSGQGKALANLGLVYAELEQYDQALEFHLQALAIDRELKDHRSEAKTLSGLGIIYYYLSQYNQAREHYQQALAINRNLKDRRGEADDLSCLGAVYDDLGQYDQAMEYIRQALAIHREIEDRQGETIDLNGLGGLYWRLGQYDRAREYYQQGLAIKRELKDRPGEGNALHNLGNVYHDLGQYERAIEFYRQALAIHREVKERGAEAQDLTSLGVLYNSLGHYDQAMEYIRQALASNRELKNRKGEADGLANLGLIYDNLGYYDQALEYYLQALAIKKGIKDRQGEGSTLNNLGSVYYNLRQYDRALKHHQQALAIARELKNWGGEGSALNNLGGLYWRLGQYGQAREYFQQALAIMRKIKDRQGEGNALTNLGGIYTSLAQYDRALEASRESLKICLEVGAPESLWRAQGTLGMVEVKLASYGEAIKHYRQALDTIERLRGGLDDKESKTAFMQDKLFMYDELIELLRSLHEKDPAKGYDREALEIFERKQGRVFLEEMGRSGARNFAGLPEQVRSQETALENRLDKLQDTLTKQKSQPQSDPQRLRSLENELQQARAAFQTLKVELQKTYPDYYALKYPQPAKLSEIQGKVLNPGEVMLVYGVMEDKICLWVIGKEVCWLHTLPIGEKDLGRKIRGFRQMVLETGKEERGVESQQGKAKKNGPTLPQELYNLLIPPQARPPLSPGSSLYIIPTGPLNVLPFEALETQAPGQPPHYLVEDYTIAYLSSASLLKTLREAQARKQAQPSYPLLAFANPRYGKGSSDQTADKSVRGLQTRAYLEIMGGGFPELPETEDEVREIKELLKAPEQSNPLQLKEAASRSTVFSLNQAAKLPDYRYLVFACHGILPGEVDRVVQPALVLSSPEKDGYLTMGDVFGLKLNAELVSLSACNTGRGAEVKGEGVIGLTRAFMYAGTPAVSVTLWSVESQSVKELNVGMYRYLSQEPGRAAALRKIKLALLRGEKGKQYRHPFFWAPLVVFGDGR